MPIVFPTITICNTNPFATNNSITFIKKAKETAKFMNINDKKIKLKYLMGSYIAKSFTRPDYVSDEVKKSLGYSFEDFFISCYFASEPCSKSDFEWYYDFNYGSCFKYNSGKNSSGSSIPLKRMNKIGKLQGLSIELFVGEFNDTNSLSLVSGAHVFIHNDTINPNSAGGLDIPTGAETNIAINKLYKNQLAKPYSDCTSDLNDINSQDSILFKEILKSNESFSQSHCFDLCRQKYIIETCNCYDTSTSRLFDSKPCMNATDLSCSLSVSMDFLKNNSKRNTCDSLCPIECNSVSYYLTVSSAKFPSKLYGKALLNDSIFNSKYGDKITTLEDLKENILSLNIYYDSFDYTIINENPNTPVDMFVANIGGTIGLFWGVSALTFFEFIEIFVEILFNICWKNKVNISLKN
jgi:hypothetical protein